MGPYKPLLLGWWVYPLLYGNNGSLDPGTNGSYTHWNKKHFVAKKPYIQGEKTKQNVFLSTSVQVLLLMEEILHQLIGSFSHLW